MFFTRYSILFELDDDLERGEASSCGWRALNAASSAVSRAWKFLCFFLHRVKNIKD